MRELLDGDGSFEDEAEEPDTLAAYYLESINGNNRNGSSSSSREPIELLDSDDEHMTLHQVQAKHFSVIKAMHPQMLDQVAFASRKMDVSEENEKDEERKAWKRKLQALAKAHIKDVRTIVDLR